MTTERNLYPFYTFLQSPQAFTALYNDYTASKGAQVSEYGAFSYDAAWLVAMAINSSLSELPVGTRLESFRHTNVSRTIRESLLKARFTGLSVSIIPVSTHECITDHTRGSAENVLPVCL